MTASSSLSGELPRIILLLVTDQFRLDAFDPNITPNLHRLSKTSTVFSNAYVSTPTCTPGRAALLTGKSPWNHGMLGYGAAVNCEEYPTTLPSVLAEAGYRTRVAGKNHFGVKEEEFVTHGYEDMEIYEGLLAYEGHNGGKNKKKKKRGRPLEDDYFQFFNSSFPGVDPLSTCNLRMNDWEACPYEFDEHYHPTPWTTRRALDYIDSFFDSVDERGEGDGEEDTDDDRMFLKVSYHRPHSPYDPPKRLWDKHTSRKHYDKYARIIDSKSWDQEFLNATEMGRAAFYGDPGDELARRTRAAYHANVEFVDEGIGSILDALDGQTLGGLEDVLVVWTTDHGDMNGDHNLWRKGYPWEGASHVPLMVHLPGQRVGVVSDAIVETRDVAPTIYDAVGKLEEVVANDPLMNGESLLPVLEGRAAGVRDRLDLEHSLVYDKRIHWNAIVGSYPDDKKLYKYIFFAIDGREQLFCLSDDPNQRNDLAATTTRDYEQYESILAYWRDAMVEQFRDEGRGDEWVSEDGTLVAGRRAITCGPNYPCPAPVTGHNLVKESSAIAME